MGRTISRHNRLRLATRLAATPILLGCSLLVGCAAARPGPQSAMAPSAYEVIHDDAPVIVNLEQDAPFSSLGIPFDDGLASGSDVSWLRRTANPDGPLVLLVINHFPSSQGILCGWSQGRIGWSVRELGLIQQVYGCRIAPTGNPQLLIMCNPARGTGFGEGLFVLFDVPDREAPRELARGPRFTRSHPYEKEIEVGMPIAVDPGTSASRIIISVCHVTANPNSNYDIGKASFKQEFLELAWEPTAKRYEPAKRASALPLASNSDLQWAGEYVQVTHAVDRSSR